MHPSLGPASELTDDKYIRKGKINICSLIHAKRTAFFYLSFIRFLLLLRLTFRFLDQTDNDDDDDQDNVM